MTSGRQPTPRQTWAWQKLRKQRLTQAANTDEPCCRCGQPINYQLPGTNRAGPTIDHLHPLAHGGDPHPPLDQLGVAHRHCNETHGRTILNQRRRREAQQRHANQQNQNENETEKEKAQRREEKTRGDENSFSGMHSQHPAPRHLKSLHVKKLTGQEPAVGARVWPEPHPDRAGSRAAEMTTWLAEHLPELPPLMGWQARVADRVLEVDDRGRFCWRGGVLLVLPRRSGKSTLLQALGMWLGGMGAEVLTSSSTLKHLNEGLLDLPRRWAAERGWETRGRYERPYLRFPAGNQWQGQAANDQLGVGFGVDVALLDEAWTLPIRAVTQALRPAMSDWWRRTTYGGLMVLTSTVETVDSDLMAHFRAAATNPHANACVIEWSADPDADPHDETTWHSAWPFWSPQQLDTLRQDYHTLPIADFASQYLGVDTRVSVVADRPLLTEPLPTSPRPAGEPVVGAVEAWFEHGCAAALAWPGTPTVVDVTLHPTLAAAAAWLRPHNVPVVAGKSLAGDPALTGMTVTARSGTSTQAALDLRRLLTDQQIRFTAAEPVTEQAAAVGVTRGPTGPKLRIARSDAIKAAVWAAVDARLTPEAAFVG